MIEINDTSETSSRFSGQELPGQVFTKTYDYYIFLDYDFFATGTYANLIFGLERALNGEYIRLHTLEKKIGEIWQYDQEVAPVPYPCLQLNVCNDPEVEWSQAIDLNEEGLSIYGESCFNPVMYGASQHWALYLHKYDEVGVLGFDTILLETFVSLAIPVKGHLLSSHEVIAFQMRLSSNPERLAASYANFVNTYPVFLI
ncbi:hypothetical protein BWI96_11840 [Siphonobacter sp. SORGH_AS_0500]|uniref:hypothetical protein n=1 Tax=Siphonobacter sp. SORGH_AS_0500 TaxID=1864824 RepID=UPI000CB0EEE9|nr:hypothetical protein [Siphonobacter sp. SORGH_AS_0500]PKK36539.1 hypothetical protein BWI96_11840 [Siphonobacter sp. SORGH_AS_0500]